MTALRCAACGLIRGEHHICSMGIGGTDYYLSPDAAPMTEAERDRIIKQISKEIEAMDKDEQVKRDANS